MARWRNPTAPSAASVWAVVSIACWTAIDRPMRSSLKWAVSRCQQDGELEANKRWSFHRSIKQTSTQRERKQAIAKAQL